MNKLISIFLVGYMIICLSISVIALPTFTDVIEEVGAESNDGSASVSFVDYNNDNRLDIFISNQHTSAILYRSEDGVFSNIIKDSGLKNPQIGEGTWMGISGVFGDYNNDAYLDIYSVIDCNPNDPDAILPCFNVLYKNDGDNSFTDVTDQAGVHGDVAAGSAAIWVDYNNDGYLDLYVVNLGIENILYRNNGDGTFTDVTRQAGVEGGEGAQSLGLSAVFFDLDNDNDQDLYVINGFGPPSFLYLNNGGTFKDITNEAGVGDPGDPNRVAVGDYDNDGYIDIYVINYFLPNVLYRNQGDGTFEDVAKQAGVDFESAGMGASFFDYDNDGHLDIYLVNKGPNVLFHNKGDGTFEDVTEQAGVVSPLGGESCAVGDYNNDGYLDIYVANSGPRGSKKGEPNQLYRNNGNQNNWLHLNVKSLRSHIDAIGTRVEVEAGGIKQVREIRSGTGISQDSFTVEFGLGSALEAEKIVIHLPDGKIQTLRNISANQILTVTEDTPSSIKPKNKLLTTLGEFKRSALVYQNFPNPFNPETWIPFTLNENAEVTVNIYDKTGRLVQMLDCGYLEKGKYLTKKRAVFWDGRDKNGERVSSGIYFYAFKAGDFRITKKMILLK